MPIFVAPPDSNPPTKIQIIYEFGHGDIAIAPSIVDGKMNTVALFDFLENLGLQAKPEDIGKVHNVNASSDTLRGVVVRLEFHKAESVDAMLDALHKVRGALDPGASTLDDLLDEYEDAVLEHNECGWSVLERREPEALAKARANLYRIRETIRNRHGSNRWT